MVEACSRGRGERRTSNVSKIIEAWHYLACSRHSEEARAIRVGESDRRLHWKGKFGPDCEELWISFQGVWFDLLTMGQYLNKVLSRIVPSTS